MLNGKNAKKLNRNQTIDLKYIIYKEYCDKIENKNGIVENIKKYVGIAGIMWFILVTIVGWGIITPPEVKASSNEQILSIQDKIRLERLEVCQNAYKNSGINEQFLYEQVPAVRCATYMSLIYAYESNFGKSRKCTQDNNCWGIKGNGVDTPRGFLKFETYKEGREYFAKKYFRFHYKKNVSQFVYSWSMTDRNTYINFVSSKFWKMYRELEYLYMTGGNR